MRPGTVVIRIEEDAILNHTGTLHLTWNGTAGTRANTGVIEVEAGGRLNVNTLGLQSQASATNATTLEARLFVNGGEVVQSGNNDTTVGGAGTALLQVTAGGSFTSARDIFMATGETGNSTLTVSGADQSNNASLLSARRLYVGGTASEARGNALAQFLNGGEGNLDRLIVYRNEADDTRGTLAINSGFVTTTGIATFEQGSIFQMTLQTANQAITEHGGLTVGGDLTLDNPILDVLLGPSFNGQEDDIYQIIRFESDLLGAGTFQGLADGDAFWVGNTPLQVHYGTLTGFEEFVTLTVIPEPAASGMVLAALTMLWAGGRRRVR